MDDGLPPSVEAVAQLQTHLQPFLASIVSLRDWMERDQVMVALGFTSSSSSSSFVAFVQGGPISSEFVGLMAKLDDVEALARQSMAAVQEASLRGSSPK
jgi:hypothetical protein